MVLFLYQIVGVAEVYVEVLTDNFSSGCRWSRSVNLILIGIEVRLGEYIALEPVVTCEIVAALLGSAAMLYLIAGEWARERSTTLENRIQKV